MLCKIKIDAEHLNEKTLRNCIKSVINSCLKNSFPAFMIVKCILIQPAISLRFFLYLCVSTGPSTFGYEERGDPDPQTQT